ncbi:MAG: hypothetical protein HN351_01640 [Deltaproteobacteria bacterium]|jgi:hypothetical protein|nr:hypothetical protein [Deltaproteobacteria bacterium]
MIDTTEFTKNAQKAATEGMETFLKWQKQAVDTTFSKFEQGIAAQESSISETRKHMQELEKNLTEEWKNQQEQFKSMALKMSETYWPESKQLMEDAEKLYQSNVSEMANKNREMLEKNIDSSLESTLNVEKEWASQLRKNYTSGADKLREQFDALISKTADAAKTAAA